MESSFFQIIMVAFVAAAIAGATAWLVQFKISKRIIQELSLTAKQHLTEVTAQRDQFAKQYNAMRAQLQSMQAAAIKRNGEYETLLDKARQLTANVRTLCTERENTKVQLKTIHQALTAFRAQTATLRSEFQKTQEFYKRELQKSFEKRKLLQNDLKYAQLELKEARADQSAFAKQQAISSTPKKGTDAELVKAAQLRLGQIEVLERNINRLEEENEKLSEEIGEMRKQYKEQEYELAEMDELRIHNRQLVQTVEFLEESRAEHETDAERYKREADESAKISDTLRFRLADLQQGFADIEKEQGQVLQSAREAAVVPLLRNQG